MSFFKLAHDIYYYLSNEVHLKGLENKYILKIKRVFKNAQSHYNESYYLTNKGIQNIKIYIIYDRITIIIMIMIIKYYMI